MHLVSDGRSAGALICVLALTLAPLGVACSSDPDPVLGAVSAEDAISDPDNSAEADDRSASVVIVDDAPNASSAVTEDDLARFVAASESAVAGTSVEGVVFDAPEIYIAIAQASCARFTEGDTLEQVVNDHLDATGAESAADEELIGAVLGAAVETICPEHTSKL